jgi:hypothetical protein
MLDKLKGLLWGSEEKDDEEEGFFLKIRVSPL